MILDSSAVVAVLRQEPEEAAFQEVISRTRTSLSAATLLETSVVLGSARDVDLDEWLEASDVTVVPFDVEQARVARAAYATYGRGSGSPARLNLGDCFAYALAKVRGEPLLFKGDDFRHTDVEAAVDAEERP